MSCTPAQHVSAKISVGSGGGGGTLQAEYNRTWDQWLMGRFVLEKPAPVRRTMGQNATKTVLLFFLNLRVRYNKPSCARARVCAVYITRFKSVSPFWFIVSPSRCGKYIKKKKTPDYYIRSGGYGHWLGFSV